MNMQPSRKGDFLQTARTWMTGKLEVIEHAWLVGKPDMWFLRGFYFSGFGVCRDSWPGFHSQGF